MLLEHEKKLSSDNAMVMNLGELYSCILCGSLRVIKQKIYVRPVTKVFKRSNLVPPECF